MSTPLFNEIRLSDIAWQHKAWNDINVRDYSGGAHEFLLSGSVGSAKSLTLAHIVVTHCLMYDNARFGIGRLALPQLKQTLCLKIREHLHEEGIDYRYNETTGSFKFTNGSTIPTLSWSDGNIAKLGSYEFSGFGIEELTETKTSDAYNTLKQRAPRMTVHAAHEPPADEDADEAAKVLEIDWGALGKS